jgi:thiamine-phosphate pyrophosphorylase
MLEQRRRIIDANLNRAGEGLHLLEELARLMLNDAELARQLKTMRHEMVRGDLAFNKALVQSRDAAGDVGADIEVPGEGGRELPIIVVANSRRVQEALRVLEELARVPDKSLVLEPNKFKKARFELYTIEQQLLSRMLRRDKAGRLTGLYAIIDSQKLGGRSHLEVAGQLVRGGASAIQLRHKLDNKDELLTIAQKLKELCAENNVLFIVNDHLDIALAVDADGLHLGQKDLPVRTVRSLLPIDMIVGVSVTTVKLAKEAEAVGADYIAVGSMYPTSSKETAVVVGPEKLRKVRAAVGLPLVAIGGINQDNAGDVAAAGADAVAVIGAIMRAENMERACRKLIKAFEAGK